MVLLNSVSVSRHKYKKNYVKTFFIALGKINQPHKHILHP